MINATSFHAINKSIKERAAKIANIMDNIATLESEHNKAMQIRIERSKTLLGALNSSTRQESEMYLNQLS